MTLQRGQRVPMTGAATIFMFERGTVWLSDMQETLED